MQRLFRLIQRCLIGAPALLLVACGGVVEQDGAPANPVDTSGIPDAVPRAESASRYGNPRSYVVNGRRYYTLPSSRGYREQGIASWYGTKFHGNRTSSWEVYDMYAMTAAHKSLPLPTYVRVTNLQNGRRVVVRVNDRGPFHQNRLIDLSYAAASKLGIAQQGTGLVEVEAIDPSDPLGPKSSDRVAGAVPDSAGDVGLYLQVGAFANRENALRLKGRVSAMAQTPVSIHEVSGDKVRMYRVRLGPLANVEEADQLVERLAQLGLQDAHVILE